MTALPLCHNRVEWQDDDEEESCALSTCVTLGEAWRNVPALSFSLLYYLPQYVAVNPNLSITHSSSRRQGAGGTERGQAAKRATWRQFLWPNSTRATTTMTTLDVRVL